MASLDSMSLRSPC